VTRPRLRLLRWLVGRVREPRRHPPVHDPELPEHRIRTQLALSKAQRALEERERLERELVNAETLLRAGR
jgi:hypothetical protein